MRDWSKKSVGTPPRKEGFRRRCYLDGRHQTAVPISKHRLLSIEGSAGITAILNHDVDLKRSMSSFHLAHGNLLQIEKIAILSIPFTLAPRQWFEHRLAA